MMLGDKPASLGAGARAAFCRSRSQPKAREAGTMLVPPPLAWKPRYQNSAIFLFWLLVVEAVRRLIGQVVRD